MYTGAKCSELRHADVAEDFTGTVVELAALASVHVCRNRCKLAREETAMSSASAVLGRPLFITKTGAPRVPEPVGKSPEGDVCSEDTLPWCSEVCLVITASERGELSPSVQEVPRGNLKNVPEVLDDMGGVMVGFLTESWAEEDAAREASLPDNVLSFSTLYGVPVSLCMVMCLETQWLSDCVAGSFGKALCGF